jgi:hypothetical protein
MMPCFYKQYFGIECPGCGFQRAFILLLKGEFVKCLQMYPPIIPILIMLGLMIIQLIMKFKNGGIWLKYWFIFTSSTIVIHYIYKQILLFS